MILERVFFTTIMVFSIFRGCISFKSMSFSCIQSSRRNLNSNIHIVGKKSGGEKWITEGCQEYTKRLSSIMKINYNFYKSDEEMVKALIHQKISPKSCFALDENGKTLTSIQFTDLVYKSFENRVTTIHFIIGGFAGLPSQIKDTYSMISLSSMTWTHQMARLLLTEQLYRATQIKRGTNYHKY